ncbi:hypothetical protein C8R46DRAFT_1031642 [Mycena filopes]|nr:hypothetical protein C8R46DRAFT_1031642 [Mycena filopes]
MDEEPMAVSGSSTNPVIVGDTPPKGRPRKKRKREAVPSGPGSVEHPFTLPDTPPRSTSRRSRTDLPAPRSHSVHTPAEIEARIRELNTSRNEAGPSRNAGGTSHTRENEWPLRQASLALEASLPRVRVRSAGSVATGVQRIISLVGWRPTRPENDVLVHTRLWTDGIGPEDRDAVKDHHRYMCGHSHCYVCIRLWLERDFTCPTCKARMYHAPFRHWGEEQALADDYPLWTDRSEVNYSFAGLLFPRQAPVPIVLPWVKSKTCPFEIAHLQPSPFHFHLLRSLRSPASAPHRDSRSAMNRRGRHAYKNVIDLGQDDPQDANVVVDRGIYFSKDGQSMREEASHGRRKKRRLGPSGLNDSFAQWVPGAEENFDEDTARNPAPAEMDPQAASILGKRKKYASTVDPMSFFRPIMGDFVDELLRHEGLGDDTDNPTCAHCQSAFERADVVLPRFFKCVECGEFLQCEACCVEQHQRTPLHTIREWNGSFWVDARLAKLGLVYQLGHGGFPCPFPDDIQRTMTIIEAPTIHQIEMRYCKCAKSDDADNLQQLLRNGWFPATVTDPGTCATFKSLEAYRMYNVVGNMNVRDFITALERFTDTTASSGMTWLPDRYKQFQCMARQWAFVKRLKRAGQGHNPAGVKATKAGRLGAKCWTCPDPERNLPPGWKDVDAKYQ